MHTNGAKEGASGRPGAPPARKVVGHIDVGRIFCSGVNTSARPVSTGILIPNTETRGLYHKIREVGTWVEVMVC